MKYIETDKLDQKLKRFGLFNMSYVLIQTFDGHQLKFMKRIAIKSELIRHMLDDIDNSELEQVVPLRHSSCTLHIVKAIMNFLIEAEKGEVNMAAFIFSLDLMAFIIALNFLEINELLRIAARTRGTLHAACVNSNLDIVKVLIEANADLESVDSDGRSPLDVVKDADCRKEIELAIILSEGWTHLMIHARRGETGKIKALIDSDGGKLVNERNGNGTGRVALHYAAERGHTDAARALIEGRADIDVKDKVTRCRFSSVDADWRFQHGGGSGTRRPSSLRLLRGMSRSFNCSWRTPPTSPSLRRLHIRRSARCARYRSRTLSRPRVARRLRVRPLSHSHARTRVCGGDFVCARTLVCALFCLHSHVHASARVCACGRTCEFACGARASVPSLGGDGYGRDRSRNRGPYRGGGGGGGGGWAGDNGGRGRSASSICARSYEPTACSHTSAALRPPPQRDPASPARQFDVTALHRSAERGHVAAVRALIELRCNVAAADRVRAARARARGREKRLCLEAGRRAAGHDP